VDDSQFAQCHIDARDHEHAAALITPAHPHRPPCWRLPIVMVCRCPYTVVMKSCSSCFNCGLLATYFALSAEMTPWPHAHSGRTERACQR
jgi:hypothetical protein